jgi:hypothetical protein
LLGESRVEVSREMSSATSGNLEFATLSVSVSTCDDITDPRPLDDAAPPLAIMYVIRYPGR